MATWTQLVLDDFQRGNTTAGAPASTTGAGNNWIDKNGGVFSILNEYLKGVPVIEGGAARYANLQLQRPLNEVFQDQRMLVQTGTGQAGNLSGPFQSWVSILRLQSNGDCYIAQFFSQTPNQNGAGNPGGEVIIFPFIGGVIGSQHNALLSPAFVPGTNYELEFTATGVSPTVIQATVRSSPSGPIVAQTSAVNDSSATLQTTGQFAYGCNYDTNPTNQFTFEVSTYINTSTSITTDLSALLAGGGNQVVHAVGVGTSWGSGTTFTYGSGSVVSKTFVDTTHYTLTLNPGSTIESLLLSDGSAYAYLPAVSPAMSPSVVFVPSGVTQNVTMTGLGTHWSTSAPTFTIDSGATISLVSVTDDFTAIVSVTAPSVGAQMTVTDTTSGASCFLDSNFSLLPGMSALYATEANWHSITSTSIETVYPGAYVKFSFTGNKVYAQVDVSKLVAASVAAGSYPIIQYTIDSGAPQIVQLTSSMSLILLTVPVTLSYTIHTFQLWYLESPASGINRYNSPSTNSVLIDNFQTNGSFTAASLSPRRLLVLAGDSISAGYYGDPSGQLVKQNCTSAIWPGISIGRNAELSVMAINGIGYTENGDGNFPPAWTPGNLAASSLGMFNSANSIVSGGSFINHWDDICLFDGTNDGIKGATDAATQASVLGLLPVVRGWAPSGNIFLIIPMGQWKDAPITAAFNAYQAATPDPKCFLIDLGPNIANGMNATAAAQFSTTGTVASPDTTHPRFARNLLAEGVLLNAMNTVAPLSPTKPSRAILFLPS